MTNAKKITLLNLAGVILLAALCVFQWHRETRQNREITASRVENESLKNVISEKEKNAAALTSDVAFFKEQFSATKNLLNDTDAVLKKNVAENAQLAGENSRLKSAIEAWEKAVADRDAAIHTANQRIIEFSNALNETTEKYNELAKKFNALAGEMQKSETAE